MNFSNFKIRDVAGIIKLAAFCLFSTANFTIFPIKQKKCL